MKGEVYDGFCFRKCVAQIWHNIRENGISPTRELEYGEGGIRGHKKRGSRIDATNNGSRSILCFFACCCIWLLQLPNICRWLMAQIWHKSLADCPMIIFKSEVRRDEANRESADRNGSFPVDSEQIQQIRRMNQ
jgi:hypothetical protein